MEPICSPELLEFRGLMTTIRTETASLRKIILSEEEATEEIVLLGEFDAAVQAQTFSTLTNLALYQIRGWRRLIDG